MTNEPKGPYSVVPDDDTGGWWACGPGHLYAGLPKYIQPSRELAEKLCALRNESYAEGYKAGRASRDGLREAAELVMIAVDIKKHSSVRGFFDMVNPAFEELDRALAEDDKE